MILSDLTVGWGQTTMWVLVIVRLMIKSGLGIGYWCTGKVHTGLRFAVLPGRFVRDFGLCHGVGAKREGVGRNDFREIEVIHECASLRGWDSISKGQWAWEGLRALDMNWIWAGKSSDFTKSRGLLELWSWFLGHEIADRRRGFAFIWKSVNFK